MAKTQTKTVKARAKDIRRARAEGTFVVDGRYLKQEAREGLKTFFAPFTGVYRAVRGPGHPASARDRD